ncbi:MAG TPA: CDGSH iron-sulfur domain-containing protein [Longimicrobiaceae bacterium]|nr:CDGSH iron-sulfur domain-containing protein [Longimicrobiaceae bacterium]
MSEGMETGSAAPQTEPQVTIKVKHNGPLLVEGPFRLVDADGNEYVLEPGKKYNLCRCGGSTNKPFCDATHTKIGFAAAERAVRAADEGGA